jgi:outer membrane protein assembly factor BamB
VLLQLAWPSPARCWRKSFRNYDGRDRLHGLVLDAQGGIVLAVPDRDGFGPIIVKLSPAGRLRWYTRFDGIVAALTARAGDGVVVAGMIHPSTRPDLGVVKLDAATGAPAWTYTIDGTYPTTRNYSSIDYAQSIALGTSGDVFVVGQVENQPVETVTLRLRGDDGAELWRVAGEPLNLGATAALDPHGDLVIVGASGGSPESRIRKHAAPSGLSLWQTTLEGTVRASKLDALGDVVLLTDAFAPPVDGNCCDSFQLVAKLAGSTGAVVWQRELGNLSLSALDVDATGDVLLAGGGSAPYEQDRWDLLVMKLSAADGRTSWSRAVDGSARSGDAALSLAVGPPGLVTVGGYLRATETGADVAILQLALSDGRLRSRFVLRRATDDDFIAALAVDPAGHVVAAGRLGDLSGRRRRQRFVVVKRRL